MTVQAMRGLFATLSLGGLLLAPSPVWAATRSAKRPVKSAAAAASPAGATCSTGDCSANADGKQSSAVDNKLGTALTWMPTPDAASRAAVDQDKLVFMIQVSGNFARQEFT